MRTKLILLITVCLLGGILFSVEKLKQSQKIYNPNLIDVPSPTPIEVSSPIPAQTKESILIQPSTRPSQNNIDFSIYSDHERNFSFEYPNFLNIKDINKPYEGSGSQEKIVLLCEKNFKTNHEEGSPFCVDGGGIRVWYNPDPGWIGGCDGVNKGFINLSAEKIGACIYENGFGSMYITTYKGNFLFDAVYSKKLTKPIVDQFLATFSFTD